MAIIKCPECGHQTSDKAPVCPSCGVEIAGKITKCTYCGEIYFKSDIVCPHCHKTAATQQANSATHNDTTSITAQEKEQSTITAKPQLPIETKDDGKKSDKRGNDKKTLLASFLIAAVVLGVCLYFYNRTQNNEKEQEEYEYAMSSTEPTVLQAYLDNFKEAPEAHRDSITAHLQRIIQQDRDWTNAIVSGSKAALTAYIDAYPDSQHKQEALDRIDSIDWEQCSKINTIDAYQLYLDEHSDGSHYDEAQLAQKKLKTNEVTLEEKSLISSIFHNFFVSINQKDETGLTSNIGDEINLLGKRGATKADVVSFMGKLYKPEIQSMTWSITGSYNIKKKEIGDEKYEYSVDFMANQDVTKTDNSNATSKYKISAKVNPDSQITYFAMIRINE